MVQLQTPQSLDQLVQQLQNAATELERLQRKDSDETVQVDVREDLPLPSLADQITAMPRKDRYHADEFLWLEGDAFIDTAYQHLFRRNVDEQARIQLKAQLVAAGNKAQILHELWTSPECQQHGVVLEGLGVIGFLRGLAGKWGGAGRLLGRVGLLLERQYRARRSGPSRRQLSLGLQAQQRMLSTLIEQVSQREQALQTRISRQADHDIALVRAEAAYHQRALELFRQQMQNRLSELATAESPDVGAARACALAPVLEARRHDKLDAYYVAFENRFRGSQQAISAHFENYLALIRSTVAGSDQPVTVVDVGCGRGEWLELLREQRWQGQGVDLNSVMVQECQRKGLQVVEQDVIEFLQTLPDNSQSVITGFHIVEHLPFDVLFRLFEEAQRVLRSGGIVLFETPNPENLQVGTHFFYHDVTHRNPVTPDSIAFLAEYTGFCHREIIRLNPMDRSLHLDEAGPVAEKLNQQLFGAQDYALVACKP